MHNEEVYVAIITGVSTLLIAVASTVVPLYIKMKNERLAKNQAFQEMRFQRAALDFPSFLENWNGVMEQLNKLMDETEIDRFLIFRAWNGFLEPRFTTAVFQLRTQKQEPFSYIHFELDDDYVQRIRAVSKGMKCIYFKTDDLDQSYIRDVYKNEGVTASVWCHIETLKLEDTASASISYCSFATHGGEISDETRFKCNLIANQLRGASQEFKG